MEKQIEIFGVMYSEKWLEENGFKILRGRPYDNKGNQYINKNWIKQNLYIDESILDELDERELYQTTLTNWGIVRVQAGVYHLMFEDDNIVHAKLGDSIFVLINKRWISARPIDHKGYYAQAAEMGFY